MFEALVSAGKLISLGVNIRPGGRFHESPRTTSRVHCPTGTTSALEYPAARAGHPYRQRTGGDAGAGHDCECARVLTGKRNRGTLLTPLDSGDCRRRRVGDPLATPDPPP